MPTMAPHTARRRACVALLAATVGMVTAAYATLPGQEASRPSEPPARVGGTIHLDGYLDDVDLTTSASGAQTLELRRDDGSVERFTRADAAAPERGLLGLLLNASTPGEMAWVAFGLLGQMLFAGRMLTQWIISERHQRSIVPPIFWWLSLTGSCMLLTYFLWRRDIVGILGQGLPLVIYVRNLMLIYGARAPAASTPLHDV